MSDRRSREFFHWWGSATAGCATLTCSARWAAGSGPLLSAVAGGEGLPAPTTARGGLAEVHRARHGLPVWTSCGSATCARLLSVDLRTLFVVGLAEGGSFDGRCWLGWVVERHLEPDVGGALMDAPLC